MHPLLTERQGKFKAAVEQFQKELASVRTGRATPALVEDVPVAAYDGTMELKGLASISVQDAKTMLISPWDKGLLQAIEKGIRDANLGVSPVVDGDQIRMVMPPMTEENRKQIVKGMKEKVEEAKIRIRGEREQMRDLVIKMEKDKEIGEDDKFKMFEDIDKLTKEHTEQIDTLGKKKEEEIMTI